MQKCDRVVLVLSSEHYIYNVFLEADDAKV